MNAIRWGLTTLVVCAVALATTTLFGEDNTAGQPGDACSDNGDSSH